MRKILLTAAILALTAGTAARACGGPTPETLKLMKDVIGSSPADPEASERFYMKGLFVENDLLKNPQTKELLAKLSAAAPRAEQLAAAAELERRKAYGCLLMGLGSPAVDLRIRCARALANAVDPSRNPIPVRMLITTATSAAVFQSGSENAALHALYQHALAESLNKLTQSNVRLKPGQDPEGLKAGVAIWQDALTRIQEAAVAAQAKQ
jgi:hypothetical protein